MNLTHGTERKRADSYRTHVWLSSYEVYRCKTSKVIEMVVTWLRGLGWAVC